MLAKRKYSDITGRTQAKDVIAYQIIQSFKPNEIDQQRANEIGYKLAKSFTKGNHAFIVCTHVDKSHIHNHIIFNSTNLDGTRKFRDFKKSAKVVARISDQLCIENRLSVILNPSTESSNYDKWLGDKKPVSHSEKLRECIDEALSRQPKNFDEFLNFMLLAGYKIKRGKHIAFTNDELGKYIRLRSIGSEYSEAKLREAIEQNNFKPREKPKRKSYKSDNQVAMDLLVNIEDKLKIGGTAYKQWGTIFNLKQMSKTILFLQENNLLIYDDLVKKEEEILQKSKDLKQQISAVEKEKQEVKDLKMHIINYAQTREIYLKYRKTNYSVSFYQANEEALQKHEASVEAFKKFDGENLPTVAALNKQYAKLNARASEVFSQYYATKKPMQEILLAKKNIDIFLQQDQQKTKNKSRKKSL